MGSPADPVRDAAYLAREALAAADRLLAELADDGIGFGALEDAEAVAAAFRDREVAEVPAPVAELVAALAAAAAEARTAEGVGVTAYRLAEARAPVREVPTGAYAAAPCDALGRGVAACGATTRVLLAPERLSGEVPAARRGWWHAGCPRCGARFLWRPSTAPSST